MRIISGKYRNKKLLDSSKLSFRPTTDRSRESLFNILENSKFIKELNFSITGCNVLDICCGTGSVSFEFLSRGANSSLLIDSNKSHLDFAKKNAKSLGLEQSCDFLLCDIKTNLKENTEKFDIIFFDPPYEENYEMMLNQLAEKSWITKDSLLIIEFDSKKDVKNLNIDQFQILEIRTYGKSSFAFCVKK